MDEFNVTYADGVRRFQVALGPTGQIGQILDLGLVGGSGR
jgi:hypothetical protein